MKKQSDRLEVMERRERNMENMILSLQNDLKQVSSRLEVQLVAAVPTTQAAGGAVSTEQATGGAVSSTRASGGAVSTAQATGGARARAPHRPPRAPRPAAAAQQEQAEVLPTRARAPRADSVENRQRTPHTSRRATLKCSRCAHEATNDRRMANHVRNIHTKPQPMAAP